MHNKESYDNIMNIVKYYAKGGLMNSQKSEMECATSSNDYATFFLKCLWVRDQAHIFHWQTRDNSKHVILGDFYDAYLEELDELIEGIFGVTGGTFKMGSGTLNLMDYSPENLKTFLNKAAKLFNVEALELCPEIKQDLGLSHTLGDVVEEINKLKYLLSQNE